MAEDAIEGPLRTIKSGDTRELYLRKDPQYSHFKPAAKSPAAAGEMLVLP